MKVITNNYGTYITAPNTKMLQDVIKAVPIWYVPVVIFNYARNIKRSKNNVQVIIKTDDGYEEKLNFIDFFRYFLGWR